MHHGKWVGTFTVFADAHLERKEIIHFSIFSIQKKYSFEKEYNVVRIPYWIVLRGLFSWPPPRFCGSFGRFGSHWLYDGINSTASFIQIS